MSGRVYSSEALPKPSRMYRAIPTSERLLGGGGVLSIASNLRFGVTTTRNPAGTRRSVAWGELIDAGRMVASRIYVTGVPLNAKNTPITSCEDARDVVRRPSHAYRGARARGAPSPVDRGGGLQPSSDCAGRAL